MTEHTREHDDPSQVSTDPAVAGQELAEPVRTGVEDVDAVLESVEGLEDRPVDEHVAVFETAHEQLRRSLDGRADG